VKFAYETAFEYYLLHSLFVNLSLLKEVSGRPNRILADFVVFVSDQQLLLKQ